MKLNLAGVAASSGLSGLVDVGTVTNTITVNGLVLPTGGSVSSTFNLPLAFKTNQILSITTIKVLGASSSLSSYSWPLISFLNLDDFANKYDVLFIMQSAANGRNIQFQFKNNTANSSVTVPNLTITATAHMFTYPF
jgi:hypothetical protein